MQGQRPGLSLAVTRLSPRTVPAALGVSPPPSPVGLGLAPQEGDEDTPLALETDEPGCQSDLDPNWLTSLLTLSELSILRWKWG